MDLEDYIVTMIPVWRRMVEDAGGQWVGVQQSFTPFTDVDPLEPYCLFTAPWSKSPISLPVSQMTPENVKEKLGIPKVEKTKKLVVKESLEHLQTIVKELLEAIQEEMKKYD